MLRTTLPALAIAGALIASPAFAATNLVLNGDFSSTTATQSRQMTDSNGTNYVANWINDNGGYNFIVTGDATVKPNSNTQSGILTNSYGYIALWGKNDAGTDTVAASNGLYESEAAHGNYIAADGAFGVSKIYQQISGLTVGQTYAVSFDWAGAQQYNYTGDTTEGWEVALSSTLSNAVYQQTADLANVSHGFTGWQNTTFTFTATSASEYLSFMAKGTPSGQPPFSLLDNVVMAAVPEPASWAMMICGFGLLGAVLRAKRPTAANHTVA